MAVQTDRQSMSLREFALAGDYSYKHVHELAWRQVIPAVQVDGKWRLAREAAQLYIANHPKRTGKGRKKEARNGQK